MKCNCKLEKMFGMYSFFVSPHGTVIAAILHCKSTKIVIFPVSMGALIKEFVSRINSLVKNYFLIIFKAINFLFNKILFLIYHILKNLINSIFFFFHNLKSSYFLVYLKFTIFYLLIS